MGRGKLLGILVTLLRIAAGALFVIIAVGKFADHSSAALDFARYGIPLPSAAVYGVGSVELSGGVLLVVGRLMRPAATLLALTLVGAIATAGRIDGGTFNLGLAPAQLTVMVVLIATGGASSPRSVLRAARRRVSGRASRKRANMARH